MPAGPLPAHPGPPSLLESQARAPPEDDQSSRSTHASVYYGRGEQAPPPQQQPVKFIPKITRYKTGLSQNLKKKKKKKKEKKRKTFT